MMKQVNALLCSVFVVLAIVGVGVVDKATAADTGVVDIQRVLQEYNKSKSHARALQEKEATLKSYRDQLAKELKDGESLSPVQKKELEERLNRQFAERFQGMREWAMKEEEQIREDILKAVQDVSSDQQLGLILSKPIVLQGGKDVTDDVINKLNN